MKKESLKEKLQTINTLVAECLAEIGDPEASTKDVSATNTKPKQVTEDISVPIANKIGDCEEFELIESKVIDTGDREAKILMCFYISKKHFGNEWLTSGHIERITSEIGIKIKTSNASTTLKKMRTYLECEESRKNGVPTKYRLNRNGLKKFESILNEKD